MGIRIYQGKTRFKIASEKKAVALRSAISLVPEVGMDIETFNKITSIEDYLAKKRWMAQTDSEGNIVDLVFDGEKLYDADQFFAAIGPFVEAGSYIRMENEGGDYWCWYFTGKRMVDLFGYIEYEKPQLTKEERQLLKGKEL